MITLAATNTLQAVASQANALTCTVFGMEFNGTTEAYKTLDQRQLPTAAGVIYTAPASTEAYIKTITVVNFSNAEQSFRLFVNGTANANALLPTTFLRPHGMATYEDGGWITNGARGAILVRNPTDLQDANYSSFYAETFDRNFVTETNTAALVSQRLQMQAIWLTAGQVIRWIRFYSATTALATGSNQLFGLYDLSRNLLAETVNDGATGWAANTQKTLRVVTPYTVVTTGLHYLAIMIHATTVPTLKGNTALVATQLHNTAPILNGSSTTGLTTSLPNPAAAITVQTTSMWGAVG